MSGPSLSLPRVLCAIMAWCVFAHLAWGAGAGSGAMPGLRAYWVSPINHAQHIGQIDWERYYLVTQVDRINYRNSSGAFYHDGPRDMFAARFVGKIEIPSEGIWTFSLGSDDGSVLYIDGEPIVAMTGQQSFRTRYGIATLTQGAHDIEVRYFENRGDSGLVLKWDGPGMDHAEVVPPSALWSPASAPNFGQGGAGLWAYWYDNAEHAKNVGQIDWANPDRVELVPRISYPATASPFRVNGPRDRFAARFRGVIQIDEPGVWTFELGSDDGSVLYIDDQLVVYDPKEHGFRWREGEISLREGEHTIEVRFWENWGDAGVQVTWQGPSDPFPETIPSSAFRPGPGVANPVSGGGLIAYLYETSRHVDNVREVDWSRPDAVDTVQNIAWEITNGAFVTGGPKDRFAMRFMGKLQIPSTGRWRFNLGSDQSARLYIDGVQIIDDSWAHGFRWRDGSRTLNAGEHDIEIQYWEGWSDAGLFLTWQAQGAELEEVIPASAFSPDGQTPNTGARSEGLRVHWVDNARHAERVGHIDWQRYDRTTYETNIAWAPTSGRFEGTSSVSGGGSATSQGGTREDHFGLRASGFVEIPYAGLWGFGLSSDESAQLLINGQMVVNDDEGHAHRARSGSIELESGIYPFEVRYLEREGEAGLSVTWTPPGGVEEVIPPGAFSHPQVEMPYDSGGGGLRAYWTTNARHAQNVGQIDWSQHHHATNVPLVAWRVGDEAFDDDTPADGFALQLQGQIDVPADGLWTFSLGSDQSAILLIDGEEVVADAQSHAYRWREGSVQLSEGSHDIEVRYFEGQGDAGLHLAWRGPTVPQTIVVPRDAFSLRTTEAPVAPGSGLRAYWTNNARHAQNAGQVDYAKHTTTSVVSNIAWSLTDGAFVVDGPNDRFALRLISRVLIPEDGLWTFGLGSDEGAVLLIDDQPVVVDALAHDYRWRAGEVELTQGEHKFELLYLEGEADAGLHVTWRAPGASHEEIIPASAFAAYETEPPYDPGQAALAVEWFNGVWGHSLDHLDWGDADRRTIEPRISWAISEDPFVEGVERDHFALRALGTLSVPVGGAWTFRLGSDQYARLLIDGQAVVEDTRSDAFAWREGQVTLARGEHQIELLFIEDQSDAGLLLTWQGPGDAFERVVPATAFEPAGDRDAVRVVRWREVGTKHNR